MSFNEYKFIYFNLGTFIQCFPLYIIHLKKILAMERPKYNSLTVSSKSFRTKNSLIRNRFWL